MLINVTGCTLDEALEALDLLDGVVAEEVVQAVPEERTPPAAWFKLPSTNTQRQGYLLHFVANGPDTREGAKTAMGLDGLSDCHTRVSELLQGGWLVETGDKRVTRSGDHAAVVTITEKTRRAVKLAKRDWFPNNVRIDPS